MKSHLGTVVALAALAACGGTSDSTNLPDAAPDVGEQGPFALVATTAPQYVAREGELAIQVEVMRGAEAAGAPVAVTLDEAPAGVTAEAITIAPGTTQGTLVVRAAADAPFARGALEVRAAAGSATARATMPVEVIGRPGTLDPTFGMGGVTTYSVSTGLESPVLAVAIDDKVIVGNTVQDASGPRIRLARYDRTGALDAGFGTAGEYVIDVTAAGGGGQVSSAGVRAGAQPDGKLVVSGNLIAAGTRRTYLVRLTTEGAVDPTFPLRLLDTLGPDDLVNTMTIGPQGEIVLAGVRRPLGVFVADPFVLRLDRDGGFVYLTALGTPANDQPGGVTVQSDGRVVILVRNNDLPEARYSLRRLTAAGALDATFGTAGVAAIEVPDEVVFAQRLVTHTGDALLVAGLVRADNFGDPAVWRFGANGERDMTFGGGDGVFTAVTDQADSIAGLFVEPDGSILLVEESGSAVTRPVYLHLDAAGVPDPAFGTGGFIVDPEAVPVLVVALRRDHRFVIAGTVPVPGGRDSTLRTYWY